MGEAEKISPRIYFEAETLKKRGQLCKKSEEVHSRHREQQVQTQALRQERAGVILGNERWLSVQTSSVRRGADTGRGWSGQQTPQLVG